MKFSSTKNILILTAGLFGAACATTTGVLPKGDGTYTINVSRGDMGKVKLRAYQHAEKFCAEKSSQGIVVTKEDIKTDPTSPTMSIIDLDFKCSGPVNSDYGKKVMKEVKKEEAKKAVSQ